MTLPHPHRANHHGALRRHPFRWTGTGGELLAKLRQSGYEVTRDDEIINMLDGFSLGSLAS
ncbi:hypothetical protein [Micromonospora sp. NPDC000668]|uniref:hypothetical protein n=1 Tax=Micromonospora sp. NPDC000668 TaxID=3364219 RepID=UPI003683F9C0